MRRSERSKDSVCRPPTQNVCLKRTLTARRDSANVSSTTTVWLPASFELSWTYSSMTLFGAIPPTPFQLESIVCTLPGRLARAVPELTTAPRHCHVCRICGAAQPRPILPKPFSRHHFSRPLPRERLRSCASDSLLHCPDLAGVLRHPSLRPRLP